MSSRGYLNGSADETQSANMEEQFSMGYMYALRRLTGFYHSLYASSPPVASALAFPLISALTDRALYLQVVYRPVELVSVDGACHPQHVLPIATQQHTGLDSCGASTSIVPEHIDV